MFKKSPRKLEIEVDELRGVAHTPHFVGKKEFWFAIDRTTRERNKEISCWRKR